MFGFLLDVIDRSAGRQETCDVLTADRGWPRAALAVRRFDAAMARLLTDAQRAGVVGADVRTDDLSALAAGGAALRAAHHDRARGLLLVRRLLDGLRADVTEHREFRDVTGHETACRECGPLLAVRSTGRPACYCGPTCRQRARRRRTRSAAPRRVVAPL